MALSIRNSQLEQAVRELSEQTGESLTQVILVAVRERLERLKGRRRSIRLADQLDVIAKRCAALPLLNKPAQPEQEKEDIVGDDGYGIPPLTHGD
jgi:antitoxin VapB